MAEILGDFDVGNGTRNVDADHDRSQGRETFAPRQVGDVQSPFVGTAPVVTLLCLADHVTLEQFVPGHGGFQNRTDEAGKAAAHVSAGPGGRERLAERELSFFDLLVDFLLRHLPCFTRKVRDVEFPDEGRSACRAVVAILGSVIGCTGESAGLPIGLKIIRK